VLSGGGGPQERDEALAGHLPFLVLSDHLTRAGYAVLRHDDRGFGQSTGDYTSATMVDFAQDAAGAFRWIAKHPKVDASQLGFIGHSEGGYIAAEAAKSVPAAFMVFLAGPAEPLLPDVSARQLMDIKRLEGRPEEWVSQIPSQINKLRDILDSGQPLETMRARVATFMTADGWSKQEVEGALQVWVTPWGIGYATHDPAPAFRSFDGPVLALFGGTDLQVSATANAPLMRHYLNHDHSEVVVFDGTNHVFQPSTPGRLEAYFTSRTTMALGVMIQLTEQLDAVSGRPNCSK